MHHHRATIAVAPHDIAGSMPPNEDGTTAGSSPTRPGSGVRERSCTLMPGARVMIGGKEEVFLGRTGDGRYVLVDADRFGEFDGQAPRHRVVSRLGTEIPPEYVKPAGSAPMDRRSRWTRVG